MRLVDLLRIWLDESPKLHHFEIVEGSYITCNCINHAWADYPSFKVYADGVVMYWHVQFVSRKIEFSAADPDFLSKLHTELVKVCKMAQPAPTWLVFTD